MTARERYNSAARRMQSAVAFDIGRDDPSAGVSPKELRVGVNTALVDHCSLAELLIAKGLITEAEYMAALADGMEREVKRYETNAREAYGTNITFGEAGMRLEP